MADDLVAELTLRLRNEMQGQVGEIRSEFTDLTDALKVTRDTALSLTEELAALRAPVGLDEGMRAFTDETSAAITAVQGIGTAIDDDITKIGEMKDAWISAYDEYHGYAAGGGGGGGGGGGYMQPPSNPDQPTSPDPESEPGPDPMPPRPQQRGHGGDVFTHVLMAGVAAGVAKESADDYAAFEQILYQTAIKEGYNSDTAGPRVDALSSMLDNLALKTGSSSSELAEAYYWLTTTGMSSQLIDQVMPSLAKDATAYGNTPLEDAQTVYTLNSVLNIPPEQMQQGLSVISKAAQLGHFGVGDFGHYLPGLGAQLSILQDTGIGGEVQVAAALEAARKVTGTSEEDAIDMQDLITYLASPTAARYFDRTKRSQDLLGAPILDLFKKYHIEGINIPQYLDKKEATGEGSFDAMMDLARLIETELPANASGSDVREIFGALFHNQQAATAALGIAQNYDVFKKDETLLYGVNDGQVQTDFNTSVNSPEGQLNITNEKFAEMNRELGQNLLPSLNLAGYALNIFLTRLNKVGEWYQTYFAAPVGGAIGTAAAEFQYQNDHQAPNFLGMRSYRGHSLDINLNIKPDGSVVHTPGATPPGVNLKVNQGTVLGTH